MPHKSGTLNTQLGGSHSVLIIINYGINSRTAPASNERLKFYQVTTHQILHLRLFYTPCHTVKRRNLKGYSS